MTRVYLRHDLLRPLVRDHVEVRDDDHHRNLKSSRCPEVFFGHGRQLGEWIDEEHHVVWLVGHQCLQHRRGILLVATYVHEAHYLDAGVYDTLPTVIEVLVVSNGPCRVETDDVAVGR